MAEIEKRISKSGKITFRIKVYKGKQDGKKITESTTFTPTKKTPKAMQKEAEDFAREFEKQVKEGKILSGEKLTLSDVVEQWKQDERFTGLTKAVQESYIDILDKRIYPHIGYLKIAKITPFAIKNIYDDMKKAGKAPTTIKRVHAVLNSVMKYACEMEIIHDNPCDPIKLPKNKGNKKPDHFTLDQAERFLDSLSKEYTIEHPEVIRSNGRTIPAYTETIKTPYQYVPFFYLAFYGGFRRGEIVALTWNDIDFENRTVSITKAISKTKEGQIVKSPKSEAGFRKIELPAQCFTVLQKWKVKQMELAMSMGSSWQGKTGKDFNDNYIFIQLENGSRMDVDTPTHKFKKAIENYNSSCSKEEDKLPDLHLHSLRHTNASILIAQNIDTATVSRRLGHSKPTTTLNIYVHPMNEKDHEASDTLANLFKKNTAI